MPVNKVRRLGSFAPLSASAYKDDALAAAGQPAELLFYRGLSFAADVVEDGFVSDPKLSRLLGWDMKDVRKRADRLVEVGLWTRGDGGYWIRSWLKWNRSKAEIEVLRRRDAGRKLAPRLVPNGDEEPPPLDSSRNPNGIQPESYPEGTAAPNGFRAPYTEPHTEPETTPEPRGQGSSDDDDERPDVERLCTRLQALIAANGSKATITAKWRTEARLLLDRDNRPADEVIRLIEWCQRDQFWKSNVLSMPTFRKQYDKLRLQAERSPNLRAVSGGYQPWRNPAHQDAYDEELI